MTNEELENLERLANAATPGPWKTGTGYEQSQRGNYVAGHTIVCAEQDDTDCVLSDQDAAFIAAASSAVPALIAEIRGLREEIEKSRLTLKWEYDKKRGIYLLLTDGCACTVTPRGEYKFVYNVSIHSTCEGYGTDPLLDLAFESCEDILRKHALRAFDVIVRPEGIV